MPTKTKKKKTEGTVQHLHFTVTGEAVTHLSRDMWISYLPKKAITTLTDGLGMTVPQAIKVLTGKAKLVGENNEVYMEKDNAKYLHPEHKSCSLHTVKKLTMLMEEELIKNEISYLMVMSDRYRKMLIEEGVEEEDAYILKSAKNYSDLITREIEQLLALYPLVDKKFRDLPIFNDKIISGVINERIEYRKELQKREEEQEELWYQEEKRREKVTKKAQNDRQAAIKEMDRRVGKRYRDAGTRMGTGVPGIPQIDVEDYVKKMIEDDKRVTIEKENISKTEWSSGYIDRRGNFYGCADLRHLIFADDMRSAKIFSSDIDDSQQALDDLGWVKISVNRVLFFTPFNSKSKKMTKRQIDAVFDYMHGKKIETFSYNGGNEITFEKFLKEIEDF